MKKFLALMFLCAGLTAMAAPHVNKADLTQGKGQMVMKSNTFTNQMTTMPGKSFMEAAKADVKRHSAEMVSQQRAPRRLSDAELVELPHVCFLYKATYDEDGSYVAGDPFYAGSGAYWYPDLSDGLYFAGFYWDETGHTYYLPLDIDYTTGDVALSWGLLLADDTTSSNAGGRNRTDTIRWAALMSEDYFLNNEQNDCMGTLYQDGSIIFDDNYVYYSMTILNTYRSYQLTSSDTTEIIDVYLGTEILVGNGTLEYTKESDNSAASNPVYMFQNEAADTLYVGNLWDYGMPNAVLTISPEAKMNYNCIITEDGQDYLYNPLWDVDDDIISGGLGDFFGIGALIETDEGYDVEWGFSGDVTPQEITWSYASMCNGYHILYGWMNNVLKWTNGNQFRIPTSAPVYTRGDVNNDGQVNITDVTVLIDHLLIQDFDDSENFNSMAADTNEDETINITDVTKLIDYLLQGTW